MPSLTAEVKIQNKLGLHARPAAMLVQTTNKFKSEILIKKNDMEVNAKSILGIMMLAAEYGSRLVLTVSGKDAEEALRAVRELFERKFDEKEKENA
jgi:phosphocarrier protein HPr